MTEWRNNDLDLVQAERGEIERGPNLEWVIVKHWKLDAGWNKDEVEVLVQIPAGYPVTPPDNFYATADLRLENGGEPGNASANQTIAGRPWLQFSYHIEPSDWQPKSDPAAGHNMLTFLAGVAKRLEDPS